MTAELRKCLKQLQEVQEVGLLQARVDGDSVVTQLPPQTVHLGLETLHVGTVY